MTSDGGPTPGWYPDPSGSPGQRYWDGGQWTEHFAAQEAYATVGRAAEEGEAGEAEEVLGDGVVTPLIEFHASRYKSGRWLSPNVIRIWRDRIEEYEHHAVRKKGTQAIHFAQVAQVGVARGLRWSDVTVESSGGHVVKIVGLRKARAEEIKAMLDDKVAAARAPAVTPVYAPAAAPAAAPLDIANQLTKLAALRDQGILTEEEFATQKARLLG